MINHQQQIASETTDKKMLELEQDNDDLQRAIDTEKAEQDRLKRLTMKKTFEDELMRMKTDHESRRRQEEIHIDQLAQKLENEKRERFNTQDNLLARENELREKENFSRLMQQTEEKLRSMEKSKFDQFKHQLQSQLEDAERNKRLEYERRMREIEREREIQFDRYRTEMHNQVQNEFSLKYQREQEKFNRVQATINQQIPEFPAEGSAPLNYKRSPPREEELRQSADSYDTGSEQRSGAYDSRIIQRHEETKRAFEDYQRGYPQAYVPQGTAFPPPQE